MNTMNTARWFLRFFEDDMSKKINHNWDAHTNSCLMGDAIAYWDCPACYLEYVAECLGKAEDYDRHHR